MQDVSTGTGITLTKPTADGTYRFTPIDARTVNTFTQTQIDDALHTIALHNHALVTGQAVRFHVQPGGTAPTNLPNDTTYFVVKVDDHTIKLASSADNAAQGMTLDIARGAGNSEYILIAQDSLVTKSFTGADVTAANAVTLANHGLSTGQAVVYRSGGGDAQRITQLTNNTVYYVIRIGDNSIKLATTVDAALAGTPTPILITNPADASRHSLTSVVGLSMTGSLVGGREHDTVALLASGRLTGLADGGDGFDTFVGPDVNSTWTALRRGPEAFGPDRAQRRRGEPRGYRGDHRGQYLDRRQPRVPDRERRGVPRHGGRCGWREERDQAHREPQGRRDVLRHPRQRHDDQAGGHPRRRVRRPTDHPRRLRRGGYRPHRLARGAVYGVRGPRRRDR